jgi:putative aldouronate transport system substrate-binding protein
MKRTLVTVLAAVMLLTGILVFAGGRRAEPAEDLNAPMEITVISRTEGGYLPYDGNIIQKFLENKHNVKFINVPIDTTGNQEQVNLFYATGGKFDVAMHNGMGTRSMREMAEDGVIRSFDVKIMRDNAPAMAAVLDKAFGTGWPSYCTINDRLYSFPVYRPTENYLMAIRGDWLRNVGGDPNNLPKTIDELETLLLKFRENDPDQNGRRDTYALGNYGWADTVNSYATYVFGAYGVISNRWNIGSDGGPVHYATMPQYREALARLAKWYKLGILDPEVVVAERQTTTEKFVAGRIGGYSGTSWMFSWDEAGTPFGALKRTYPELNDDVRVILPPVSGPGGKAQTVAYSSSFFGNSAYFGADTSDAKLAKIFQIWNDFVADPRMYTMNLYGIEGQQYDLDSDGFIVARDTWTSAEKKTEIGVKFYFIDGWKYDGVEKYENSKSLLDVLNVANSFDALQVYPLDSLSTQIDVSAVVNPIIQEFALKVVTGEWDVVRDWDAYVARLNTAGLQREIDAKRVQAREYGIIK